jgi:hypothetical protein
MNQREAQDVGEIEVPVPRALPLNEEGEQVSVINENIVKQVLLLLIFNYSN